MDAAWSGNNFLRKWELRHMRDDIAEQIALMEEIA
jgi:hypothetical protein